MNNKLANAQKEWLRKFYMFMATNITKSFDEILALPINAGDCGTMVNIEGVLASTAPPPEPAVCVWLFHQMNLGATTGCGITMHPTRTSLWVTKEFTWCGYCGGKVVTDEV